MIKDFEERTAELNKLEKETIVPLIVNKLKTCVGKKRAIKNGQLIAYLYVNGIRISEPRVRKIIEYIRQQRKVDWLIAAQYGYFIAETEEQVRDWINTMKTRRNAIETTILIAEGTLSKVPEMAD